MKLEYFSNVGFWVFHCNYSDKLIPKKAGFEFDWTGNIWWTADPIIAAKLYAHGDAKAKAEIDAGLKHMESAINASKADNSTLDIPKPAGQNYLNYQKAGIEYAATRKFTLLADQPGCGKTVQALGLVNLKGYKNVLIVCPASLKGNWHREASKWLIGGQAIQVLDSKSDFPSNGVVIVNYDILKKFNKEIRQKEWDLLVCDESHYLKNSKALRTAEVVGNKTITPIKAKQTMFLTGTPILNRPEELWTTVKYAGLFTNWFDFVTRYCNGVQTGWGWDTSGASNLDELNTKLRTNIMVRRCKSDVLKELPAKTRRTITISATGKIKKVLNEATEKAESMGFNMAGEFDVTNAEVIFESLARARVELGIHKAEFAAEYIQELLNGGVSKLVVFAHHRIVLDKIQESLQVPTARIDGTVAPALRQAEVDKFQSGGAQVFLGTLGAAGVGITLTAASHMVIVEPSWNPALLCQGEDRLHRIGQANAVQIDYLVYKDSIDEYMLNMVLEKGMIEATALDGDGQAVEKMSQEELDAYIAAVKEANREQFEAKKGSEVAKTFISKFLKGEHALGIFETNGELHEIKRVYDGWLIDGEFTKTIPAFDRFWHQNKCAHCGRPLTDPESIARGLGPICAGRL